MPLYKASFHLSMMMLFPLIVLTAITAAGVGIYTSALNVKYRDIRYALPFAIQIWMFVTPVIYPVSFLPQRWRWLLGLNPLSGIIEGFHAAIFGHPLKLAGPHGFDCDRWRSVYDRRVLISQIGAAVRRRYPIPMLPMMKVRGLSIIRTNYASANWV
jgi:ABC-type polysaccharide/polyol phosphate export permease